MRLPIIAFAGGVLLLQMQPAVPDPRAWAVAGLLLLLLGGCRAGWGGRGMAIVACGALGFAWAGWRAELRLADRLDAAWAGRDVEVVGVVASLPQPFEDGVRFEFDAESASTVGGGVPRRLQIAWYARKADGGAPPAVRAGERWRFTVRLKPPHGNANPGGFDYEAWLLERNIRATGYVRSAPARRLDALVARPAYLIERLRQAERDAFARALPAAGHPWAGILVALAVGDQRAIPNDLWAVFNRTGTTHLMSISGLHVTLVAALAGWLLAAFWRRVPRLANRLPARKAGLLGACAAALAYALLAGFAVPAQRTLYMLLVAAAALLSGRIVAPGRILSLALLAVLAVDPWSVLAPGFWLSFGAVGALLYVGSAAVGEGRDWRRRLRSWGTVQWAATLASLPVLLLVFQQFPLVSPLANAVAIPAISFVVTPLALLGALVHWSPILLVAHAVLGWLMHFLVWCADWPVWQAPVSLRAKPYRKGTVMPQNRIGT